MLHRRHKILFPVALSIAAAGLFALGCVPDAPDGFVGPGPTLFSITLSWDAPTVNAAGDTLDDLAGYQLYYNRTSPPEGPGGGMLELGLETSATVDSLEAGAWFFSVAALDAAGNESEPSAALEVDVGAP